MPCYIRVMRPGDTPNFRPSLHTPTRALNQLSQEVGMVTGLQVTPPLTLETTPAGYLISLTNNDFTAFKVPGMISTSDQYLGYGIKKVEHLEIDARPHSLSTDNYAAVGYGPRFTFWSSHVYDAAVGSQRLAPITLTDMYLYSHVLTGDNLIERSGGILNVRQLLFGSAQQLAIGSVRTTSSNGWAIGLSVDTNQNFSGEWRYTPGSGSTAVYTAFGNINIDSTDRTYAYGINIGLTQYWGQTATTLGGTFVGGLLVNTSRGSTTLPASAITGTLPAGQVGGVQGAINRVVTFTSETI